MFYRKLLAVLIFCFFLEASACWCTVSFAQKPNTINGVGFASMEKFSFDSKLWDNHFSQLAQQSYLMKYSAFKQIAEKLQMQNLRPFTLELPPEGNSILPANVETVRKFYKRWESEADRFLQNLSLANNAALIVFDYVERFTVQRYINGKIDHFVVTIIVYHLDSNAMGLTHIQINRNEFSKNRIDYYGLKSKVHRKILKALEEAVVSTSGIISSDLGMRRKTADPGQGNEKAEQGESEDNVKGPEQGFGGKSGMIEDSYLSEEEKKSFWE